MSATDNINYLILSQTAVYWPWDGTYDQFGVPQLGSPVEISVRWENRVEEFITSDGTIRMTKAVVYTDRDVTVGGVLMLGDLESSTDLTDPKENDGAEEILRFDKLPDFAGEEYLRTAYL